MKIFETINFEKIVDHPNILIAANFWDKERFHAAKTCYKYLRTLDDSIDGYKSRHGLITQKEKPDFMKQVGTWLEKVNQQSVPTTETNELIETINKFRIPSWPMETFARSMVYDINHDGFQTLDDFIEYSQGASVAPASIFVHLCGLRICEKEYLLPDFDVREAATPCAMFSYIVHIIRDFQKDQHGNLNYFARDILKRNQVDPEQLKNIANGAEITSEFRNLIHDYYDLADHYRQDTIQTLSNISKHVEPEYLLSLHIIFDLYLMVFKRIDYQNGDFSTQALNPTPTEIKEQVLDTIMKFTG